MQQQPPGTVNHHQELAHFSSSSGCNSAAAPPHRATGAFGRCSVDAERAAGGAAGPGRKQKQPAAHLQAARQQQDPHAACDGLRQRFPVPPWPQEPVAGCAGCAGCCNWHSRAVHACSAAPHSCTGPAQAPEQPARAPAAAAAAADTTVEQTLMRLGSSFEVVPLPSDSAFVQPASVLYELDGAQAASAAVHALA